MNKDNKKKICGIYKISNENGGVYIGQSTDIYWRWKFYESLDCESQRRLYNSLKKYGFENHTFEIIEECPREMLNEREIYWIQFHNSFNTENGMNLQFGGYNGSPSEETKKKIREAQKGKKKAPLSEEHKEKLRKPKSEEFKENLKGNKNVMGYKWTEEQIKKQSEAQKRRPPTTEETKKKISEAGKGNKNASGYKQTKESNRKRSEKLKGYKQSPEHIAKVLKTKREKKELKQHMIQSIIFRQNYFSSFLQIK